MEFQTVDLFESVYAATSKAQADMEGLANQALSKGIDRYMSQDFRGAIKDFKRAIGLAQYSSYATDTAHYMADAYLALEDTNGAIKAYKTAIRLNPFRDDSHLKLGNLYFQDERYEEAVQEYKEAVRLYPDANNIYSLGQGYMYAGRYADAEQQFNRVLRLDPDKPSGNYGLGLNSSRQERLEEAIVQFKQAVRIDPNFSEARAELGYAYADMGDMEQARSVLKELELAESDLADTLSRYIYKQDPPKMVTAYATSTFGYYRSWQTPVATLDSYLQTAGAEKTLTMEIQFSKEMDRSSVENVLNWRISRSTQAGPGQAYNYGRPIPETEIDLSPFPAHIYYDEDAMTATIYFKVTQNDTTDGTIDPSHVEFKFSGEDLFGNRMDSDFDQFTGFSGVA